MFQEYQDYLKNMYEYFFKIVCLKSLREPSIRNECHRNTIHQFGAYGRNFRVLQKARFPIDGVDQTYFLMRDRCVLPVNAGVVSFKRRERVLQQSLLSFLNIIFAPGLLFHECSRGKKSPRETLHSGGMPSILLFVF